MALEEGGRYLTVKWVKVNVANPIENHVFYFGAQLVEILWVQKKSAAEREALIENEVVLGGITDNTIMPNWRWHQATWKCLGGNTGWKKDNLKEFFAGFDILIHEERD